MPSRNVRKSYIENGHYHVYNRGVEKRKIFEDTQDYKVFLSYLKEYLNPPPKPEEVKTIFTLQGETFQAISRQPKNYHKKIQLLSYCLMPNHFHLLLKQVNEKDMQNFVQSLGTRYSMYFNKKYKRVGSLFQGPYKAVLVNNEEYLLHLSRYIHLNPSEYSKDIVNTFSSYADYLKLRKTPWVKTDMILSFFGNSELLELKKHQTYKDFVEKYARNPIEILGKLTLEYEDNEED